MKTFGFFMFVWLAVVLAIFNIFKNVSDSYREILLFTLGTLLSYIFYKLIKEEEK